MPVKIWGTLDPFFEKGPFLGRIVANSGFLSALLRADPYDEYHFFLPSKKSASDCRQFIKKNFKDVLSRVGFFPRTDLIGSLYRNSYHIFHLSDCINYPAHLARLRNRYSKSIFPITSITHSLSYSNYCHMLLKQLWPGWSVRDAIICSSQCGQEVLKNYFQFLSDSYCPDKMFKPPGLKHIPLGIDIKQIQSSHDNVQRPGAIDAEKLNILSLGRISCYSKMDILPVLKSFQLAKLYGLDLNTVRLVLAGGLDQKDDTVRKLSMFAKNIGLEIRIFPNADHCMKSVLLRDSDIFISMSDNPQETFGLTIIEAQAAGLPVVASDYNGYRELITDSENGFLIPTLGPDNTEYIDDLAPLIHDSESHLLLAQSCTLDLHIFAGTLVNLISRPDLRKKVSEKAALNAQNYDWSRVITRYIDFWDELAARQEPRNLADIKHPLHTPYSEIFSGYVSDFWINSVLSQSRLGKAVYQKKDFPVIYAGLAGIIDPEKLRMLLFLSRKPLKSSSLISRLSASLDIDPLLARQIVAWAIKQGYLQAS